MCTKMNETDWEIALAVFRACLPARGAKARDDRLFLEALHFFMVPNITWRVLPERFGKWNCGKVYLVNRTLELMRSICQWALEHGLFSSDPSARTAHAER